MTGGQTCALPISNHQASKIYGYKYEELVNLSGKDIIHPDYYHLFEKFIHDVAKTNEFHAESVDVRKDGTLINTEVKGAPINIKGKPHLLAVIRDITQQKQAEEALRQSEKKFRDLFNEDLTGNFVSTPDGKLILCNPAYANIMGFDSANEMLKTKTQTFYKNIEDRNEIIKKIKENRKLINYEYPLIRKDGKEITVLANILGEFDEKEKLILLKGYLIDISDRKKAELELTKATRLYAVLSNINQMIVRVRDKQTIFEETCRIAVENGKFKMAWIGLVDEKLNRVVSIASAGFEEDYLDTINIDLNDVELSNGPTGHTVKLGTPFVVNEVSKQPEMGPWKEKASKLGYHSSAAFPIIADGKTIAILNLYAGETFFFDDKEVKLLDELVQDISYAIDFINSETERKISEQELRKLSTAITQSPAAIVITNTQGAIEYVNPKFSEITGYSFAEVKGKNPRILKGTENSKIFFKSLWETIVVGKMWKGVFKNKKKNNS